MEEAGQVVIMVSALLEWQKPPARFSFRPAKSIQVVAAGRNVWKSAIRQRGQHWGTLNRLLAFHGENAKAIVWQHNTHIGDARATDMAAAGMLNTGELARTQYQGENIVLVGFGSYKGKRSNFSDHLPSLRSLF